MKTLSIRALIALLAAGACAPSQPTVSPTPLPPAARPNANLPRPEPADAPAGEPAEAVRPGGRAGGTAGEPSPAPYARVVTAAAETREGLFKVHRIGPKVLFEIPADHLGKDMLLVTEIARTVLGSGYGGQAVSNGVYRWERRGDRIDLRSVSYGMMADSTRPEYLATSCGASSRPAPSRASYRRSRASSTRSSRTRASSA